MITRAEHFTRQQSPHIRTARFFLSAGAVAAALLLAVFGAAPSIAAENLDADGSWNIEIVPRTNHSRELAANLENGPVITPLWTASQPASSNGAPAPTEESQEADWQYSQQSDAPPSPIDPALYEKIYRSIPFSRAEYVANPGYRHQATMSLILGQPYLAGPYPNYEPKVLTSFPVTRHRPTRPLFGYRPFFWRPWYYGPHFWRPY